MDNGTVEWLLEDRAQAYLTVATATCFIYDCLTTLSDEIELVWNRPGWDMPKFLFFVTRYMGHGTQIYSIYAVVGRLTYSTTQVSASLSTLCTIPLVFHHCLTANRFNWSNRGKSNPLFLVDTYLQLIPLFAMQGIMIYRISSMYHTRGRELIVALTGGWFMEIISVIAIKISTDRKAAFAPDPTPIIHICVKTLQIHWILVTIGPLVFFEFVLIILPLGRAISYYRSQTKMTALPFQTRQSLASILYRDSVTFPFITLVMLLVSLVAFIRNSFAVAKIVFVLMVFWPGIAGPRLILNLREAYYKSFEEECNVLADNKVDLMEIHRIE